MRKWLDLGMQELVIENLDNFIEPPQNVSLPGVQQLNDEIGSNSAPFN